MIEFHYIAGTHFCNTIIVDVATCFKQIPSLQKDQVDGMSGFPRACCTRAMLRWLLLKRRNW